MEANSIPITPAPTITIVDGNLASLRTMSSESRMVLPLNSISAGWAGTDPVAITTAFAATRRSAPSRASTTSVCGST